MMTAPMPPLSRNGSKERPLPPGLAAGWTSCRLARLQLNILLIRSLT
jgi:hypothetical protein